MRSLFGRVTPKILEERSPRSPTCGYTFSVESLSTYQVSRFSRFSGLVDCGGTESVTLRRVDHQLDAHRAPLATTDTLRSHPARDSPLPHPRVDRDLPKCAFPQGSAISRAICPLTDRFSTRECTKSLFKGEMFLHVSLLSYRRSHSGPQQARHQVRAS